jgi:hypothetical protein
MMGVSRLKLSRHLLSRLIHLPLSPHKPHILFAGLYKWGGGLVYQFFRQSPREEFRKSDNMPDLFLNYSELGDKRWSNSLLMGDYKRFRSFLTGFD